MNGRPGLLVIAMVAVVGACACGKWQGQPEPRAPRVKLLTSEAVKRAFPVPLSWCAGTESELAVPSVGNDPVYFQMERVTSADDELWM